MTRPQQDDGFRGPEPTYMCCDHCITQYDPETFSERCWDAINLSVPNGEPAHFNPCPEGCQT